MSVASELTRDPDQTGQIQSVITWRLYVIDDNRRYLNCEIVQHSTSRFAQPSFNYGVSLKGNELNKSTHHSGGLLIFVEMKRHFLQHNIELFPLPEELKNELLYR